MCSGGTHKRVVRDGEIGNRSAVEAADYFDELPADRVRGRGPEEGIRHGDEVGTCFCGHTRHREVQAEEPARSDVGDVGDEERPRARVVSSGPAAACHSGGRQRGWGWIAPGGVLACDPPPPLRLSKLYLLAARSPNSHNTPSLPKNHCARRSRALARAGSVHGVGRVVAHLGGVMAGRWSKVRYL